MIWRPLVEKALGTFFRAGLSLVGGYLMAQGMVSEDQQLQLVALAPVFASVAWSLYEKLSARAAITVARANPEETPVSQITGSVQGLSLMDKFTFATQPTPSWAFMDGEDED